jgi:uncharacterized protein YjbJ (UPF0337 family)
MFDGVARWEGDRGEHVGLLDGQGAKQERKRGLIMGDHNSGPEEGIKGTVEGVKGKAKEVAGSVVGRDDVVREGKAQQDKADAQRDAAKKEAEADAARSGADSAEQRQKKHQ